MLQNITGKDGFALQRPETLPSKTTKVKTGYGSLYVTVCEDDGKPFEVFLTIGKSGQSIQAKAEVTGRLTSLALRYGVPLEEIVNQLKGIGGQEPTPSQHGLILSIPDALGKVLERMYLKGDERERGLEG